MATELRTIRKYEIPLQPMPGVLTFPGVFDVLDTQIQDGKIMLWVLVTPESDELSHHQIHIVGTGHVTNCTGEDYCGTVQKDGFVWHIFLETIG